MIIILEGPRNSGKSFLLNEFFKQNTDPNIEYYKWFLGDWIKTLGLQNREQRGDVHYLSVGNILTIFDLMKDRNDKIIVFDRALITAYVWANLRGRISKPQCDDELERILKSDSYQNIRTIYINPNPSLIETKDTREKDFWDNLHTAKEEYTAYDDILLEQRHHLNDKKKKNYFYEFYNEYNTQSIESFVGLIDGLRGLINT